MTMVMARVSDRGNYTDDVEVVVAVMMVSVIIFTLMMVMFMMMMMSAAALRAYPCGQQHGHCRRRVGRKQKLSFRCGNVIKEGSRSGLPWLWVPRYS